MTGSRRGLKICCGVTAVFLIIIFVVLIILYFTLLKPKEPGITPQPATLEYLNWSILPIPFLNFTVGITATIDNKNYGAFKYEESTVYISYHRNVVGDGPIPADEMPARAKRNVSTLITVSANSLSQDPAFGTELISGIINLTSASTLHGKAILLKLFKKKATSFTTCDITLFLLEYRADSLCKSKVSF